MLKSEHCRVNDIKPFLSNVTGTVAGPAFTADRGKLPDPGDSAKAALGTTGSASCPELKSDAQYPGRANGVQEALVWGHPAVCAGCAEGPGGQVLLHMI